MSSSNRESFKRVCELKGQERAFERYGEIRVIEVRVMEDLL